VHIGPGRTDRRCDTEKDRAQDCNAARERDDHGIDGRAFETRYVGGRRGDERVHTPPRQRQAAGACEQGKDETFGEQLTHDPTAPRAKRYPDRELAGARRAASEQEVRDISARDQQDEPDGAEQREQPTPVVPDELVHHRRQRKIELAVLLRKAHAKALGVALELCERLFLRNAGLQPRVDLIPMFVVHGLPFGGEGHWYPQILGLGREVECRGHDAKDFVGPAVQADPLADDGRISGEAAGPEPMAQDDDLFPARLILFGGEDAASCGTDTKNIEEACGGLHPDDALDVLRISHVEARIDDRRRGAETLGRGDSVHVVARGARAGPFPPQGIDRDDL
jgi:hypothetical protein